MALFQADPHHGNVVFNFRGQPLKDLSAFAQGYHLAGRALAQRMSNSSGYADYEGYPILFLYRHALELYIKAIIYTGAKYVGLISDNKIDYEHFFRRHRLSKFLPALEVIWKHMNWDWDFGFDGMTNFEDFANFITEVESVDPDSFSFRYPVMTNLKSTLPHHFVVNVISYAREMEPILDCLSGAVTGIDHDWQNACEIIYEAEQIIRDALE